MPYHGGFGLLNIYGIPKPAYRAYELLHRLGNEIFEIQNMNGLPMMDDSAATAGKAASPTWFPR